jgi:pyroglutamyl-peptidase
VTVLITGFGPFPGAPVNPTEALVRQLARRHHDGDGRIGHVFRTSYAAVEAELPKLIDLHRPDAILLLGLATRSAHLRIETRAVNSRSLLAADIDGFAPKTSAIDPGAPAALAGRAPHVRLVAAARAAGVPARLSRSAGRYLCNYAYWRALELSAPGGPLVQFVHVPLVHGEPAPRWRLHRSLSLSDLVRAAEAILSALATAARERHREMALTG